MRYICCQRCYEECKQAKEPMRVFERISVSLNDDETELLIWCNRHNCEVTRVGVGNYSAVDCIDEELVQAGKGEGA